MDPRIGNYTNPDCWRFNHNTKTFNAQTENNLCPDNKASILDKFGRLPRRFYNPAMGISKNYKVVNRFFQFQIGSQTKVMSGISY